MTPEEVEAVPDHVKMRAAFLLAADYPAAVVKMQRDGFRGQADIYSTLKAVTE